MITQLDFGLECDSDLGGPMCIWAEDFPIDLQKGDTIWIDDFWHLFNSGEYYIPQKGGTEYDNCIEKHKNYFTMLEVIDIMYGIQENKIVKIITCEEK